MAADLQALNDQISQLQKKKEALQNQEAVTLFKKLKAICGTDFSPSLILGIVSTALPKASSEQKEAWMNTGKTFLRLKKGKDKTTPKKATRATTPVPSSQKG